MRSAVGRRGPQQMGMGPQQMQPGTHGMPGQMSMPGQTHQQQQHMMGQDLHQYDPNQQMQHGQQQQTGQQQPGQPGPQVSYTKHKWQANYYYKRKQQNMKKISTLTPKLRTFEFYYR